MGTVRVGDCSVDLTGVMSPVAIAPTVCRGGSDKGEKKKLLTPGNLTIFTASIFLQFSNFVTEV